MSVMRSPQAASPVSLDIPKLQLSQISSEPSHDTDESIEPGCPKPSKLTTRGKRKRTATSDDKLTNFMQEMKKMFDDFKKEQNSKYDKLCSTVEEIRSPIDFLANRLDSIQAKLEQLNKDRQNNLMYIKTLEDKIDSFERYQRSTCIEIRNIPMSQGENKASLVSTAVQIGQKLNADIQASHIKDIYRIRTGDPAVKTIIVDLNSVLLKEQIIGMNRRFLKSGSTLTTEHLRIKGPARPIFISENLTTKMKKLFFQAREFAKANKYRFCWVSNGKIFLRKVDQGVLVRVNQESDLTKLLTEK